MHWYDEEKFDADHYSGLKGKSVVCGELINWLVVLFPQDAGEKMELTFAYRWDKGRLTGNIPTSILFK